MITSRKFLLLFTTFAALLVGTSVGRAGLGGIRDGGAFFSDDAKADASRTIGDVERTLKKDIVIETFPEIPEAVKGGVNVADKAALNRLFVEWAEKQARQQAVNGVYVLISKQPAHLQVVVGNQTLKQLFTTTDRDALVSTMRTKLHARDNDGALREGVNFVASTMRAHAAGSGHAGTVQKSDSQSTESGFGSGWLLPVIGGLLIGWIIFGLLRAMMNRGGAGAAGMPQGAGGGGFFSSLIGGMFGAAAGMWMYNQFLGSDSHASTPSDHNANGDGGVSGQDTDYSSSGSDFGNDSGGGDSGGGDSGGGGDF